MIVYLGGLFVCKIKEDVLLAHPQYYHTDREVLFLVVD